MRLVDLGVPYPVVAISLRIGRSVETSIGERVMFFVSASIQVS